MGSRADASEPWSWYFTAQRRWRRAGGPPAPRFDILQWFGGSVHRPERFASPADPAPPARWQRPAKGRVDADDRALLGLELEGERGQRIPASRPFLGDRARAGLLAGAAIGSEGPWCWQRQPFGIYVTVSSWWQASAAARCSCWLRIPNLSPSPNLGGMAGLRRWGLASTRPGADRCAGGTGRWLPGLAEGTAANAVVISRLLAAETSENDRTSPKVQPNPSGPLITASVSRPQSVLHHFHQRFSPWPSFRFGCASTTLLRTAMAFRPFTSTIWKTGAVDHGGGLRNDSPSSCRLPTAPVSTPAEKLFSHHDSGSRGTISGIPVVMTGPRQQPAPASVLPPTRHLGDDTGLAGSDANFRPATTNNVAVTKEKWWMWACHRRSAGRRKLRFALALLKPGNKGEAEDGPRLCWRPLPRPAAHRSRPKARRFRCQNQGSTAWRLRDRHQATAPTKIHPQSPPAKCCHLPGFRRVHKAIPNIHLSDARLQLRFPRKLVT